MFWHDHAGSNNDTSCSIIHNNNNSVTTAAMTAAATTIQTTPELLFSWAPTLNRFPHLGEHSSHAISTNSFSFNTVLFPFVITSHSKTFEVTESIPLFGQLLKIQDVLPLFAHICFGLLCNYEHFLAIFHRAIQCSLINHHHSPCTNILLVFMHGDSYYSQSKS